MKKNILITGANGYIGKLLLERCANNPEELFSKIIALDIKVPAEKDKLEKVTYVELDIRSEKVAEVIAEFNIDAVVHLAAIISITGKLSRDYEYDVDVNGSINLINACVENNVERFVFSSSGAAYGYWPSNVENLLTEEMEIKGNYEIPYSYHKWLVEQKLEKVRESYPNLKQYIFRVGTILGKKTSNPITDYLKKDKILCLKGYESKFVAIWDEDLVNILYKATHDGKEGVYNVAGTGSIPTSKIAEMMNKPTQTLPIWVLKIAFKILNPLGIIPYGPESLKFIQYRPVLENQKLKKEFAYTPKKTTKEVFEYWIENNLNKS